MIRIPGKIFISGEYAALKGLPALTVAVSPGFEFTESNNSAFHPASPAGLYNQNLTGDFFDPYKGIGGLGRSTAEFIAAAYKKLGHSDLWNTWTEYRNLLQRETNTPSGVDLLTQIKGGYCLTDTITKEVVSLNWPFANLDWVAVVTGNKVKTHEHLDKSLDLNWDKLQILNQKVNDAFMAKDTEAFVQHLKAWREFLFASNLEASATTELLDIFLDIPGVRVAKGCGALGSDVVFVVFEKGNSTSLEKSLEFWNPRHIIRSHQVSFEGVQVLNDHENISTL